MLRLVLRTQPRSGPSLIAAQLNAPTPFFRKHPAKLGEICGKYLAKGKAVYIEGMVLNRAYEAVPAGGAVLVYDQMLDDAEPDLHSALAGLNVALMTSGGSEYTIDDCRGWFEKAGFRIAGGRRLYTVGNDYVLVAEKP